jgi:hypothetical protein
MPNTDDSELDCSELTDVSEEGLIRWADKHQLFAPANQAPLVQEPLIDPCEELKDSRHIRRTCGGARAPGDDPCYEGL